MGKIEHGKEQFFSCLYTGLFDRVCSSAYFFCGEKETAKDLAQNVFMKVWKHIDHLLLQLKEPQHWENYLFIMARNEAMNHNRKQTLEAKARTAHSNFYKTAAYNYTLGDQCGSLLKEALKGLTHRQTEVYLLNHYGIKSYDIGPKLGITYSTVKNTLWHAQRRIRSYVYGQL